MTENGTTTLEQPVWVKRSLVLQKDKKTRNLERSKSMEEPEITRNTPVLGRSLSSEQLPCGTIAGSSSHNRSTRKPRTKDTSNAADSLTAPSVPYEWIKGWVAVDTEGNVVLNQEDDSTISIRLDSTTDATLLESSPNIVALPSDKLENEILFGNTYDNSQVPSDLCTLPHFHESAIVECLEARYHKGLIYTSTGPVLLAVNPFGNVDHVYTAERRADYWSKAEDPAAYADVTLEPHVYQMADDAFRGMLRAITATEQKDDNGDQSILVSGESGAGKTVTTKHVMQYLAALSERSVQTAKQGATRAYQKVQTNVGQPTSNLSTQNTTVSLSHGTMTSKASSSLSSCIETQVLQSNPILEAFGNARTVRNDNSSRFGKCIDLQFSEQARLVGTSIETYLLEKVRVVHQAPGERNYHVFYQLLAPGALDPTKAQDWGLMSSASTSPTLLHPRDFKLLCGSGTFGRRDDVSDKDTYNQLMKAMRLMGFSESEQESVLATTAALLHASNIQFTALEKEANKHGDDDDTCQLDGTNHHLKIACKLLGITPESANEALCSYTINVRGNPIRKIQTLPKAQKGLDALLKATYGSLFTYLVQRINESIQSKDSSAVRSTIGVLDIFGFESFAINSFEQLCINYCNEVLQQQFNTYMLKNEQATYANEGIDWDYITFPENQDVLDLLDDRKDGIISILDDMCRAPNATDKGFSSELVKRCKENPRFQTDYKESAPFFTIQHYAGSVEYGTENFVEKNRDDLPRETNMLLLGSSRPFVHKLAEIIQHGTSEDATSNGKMKKSRPTVGAHFMMQVKQLRTKIEKTAPHYIRCIKPNALLAPNNFDRSMVAGQLRCGGVLQAVGVTRNGYTLHYTHNEFIHRYMCLVPRTIWADAKKNGVKPMVEALVSQLVDKKKREDDKKEKQQHDNSNKKKKTSKDEDVITLGKSKILLKHHAFESLEEMLGAIQSEKATRINALMRRFLCRTAYHDVRKCFRQELQQMGTSFEEWFKENRELYYQPRKKNLGYQPIKNIVKLRQQMIQKAANKRSEINVSDRKRVGIRQIQLQNPAWILHEGLWVRNPNFMASEKGKEMNHGNTIPTITPQTNLVDPL